MSIGSDELAHRCHANAWYTVRLRKQAGDESVAHERKSPSGFL